MGKSAPKRSWLAQLLFDQFVVRMVVVTAIFFIVAPACQAFADLHGDHVALSAETTAWLFLNKEFGPRNVLVSQVLYVMGQESGISDFTLKAVIAAAAVETPRPPTMTYYGWLEKVYRLAADLLGLAHVESNFCRNLGTANALEELERRLERARRSAPPEVPWWEANIRALEQIAGELGMPVESIRGSRGAGAISCFQLMPANWLRYGGGDYRDHYQAARNAVGFLRAHGYEEDRVNAFAAYNPNAGQPYVVSVLNAAAPWAEPVKTALILVPVTLNPITLIMEFSEILAWYMNQAGVAIGSVGEIANPHPGSFICGNSYGAKLGPNYTHHGVDLCIREGGASVQGPVYAIHDGRVVLSRLVDNSESIAWNVNDPGYISASGYVVKLEGTLPDGRILQTIYAHLDPNTIPPVGATLRAGDYLGTTRCSFDRSVEYCTGHHLHLGSKLDGVMVNPLELFAEIFGQLLRVILG